MKSNCKKLRYHISKDAGKTWEKLTLTQVKANIRYLCPEDRDSLMERLRDGLICSANGYLYQLMEVDA